MKWRGQYVESTQNMELALKFHEESKDYWSIVRVLCFLENPEQAAVVANSSNDPAACYEMARYYDKIGQIENAVDFFVKSNVYSNAIRICKVTPL
jgi:hypothetical protein